MKCDSCGAWPPSPPPQTFPRHPASAWIQLRPNDTSAAIITYSPSADRRKRGESVSSIPPPPRPHTPEQPPSPLTTTHSRPAFLQPLLVLRSLEPPGETGGTHRTGVCRNTYSCVSAGFIMSIIIPARKPCSCWKRGITIKITESGVSFLQLHMNSHTHHLLPPFQSLPVCIWPSQTDTCWQWANKWGQLSRMSPALSCCFPVSGTCTNYTKYISLLLVN